MELGGFWIGNKFGQLIQPIMFWHRFPPLIATALISLTNPVGALTNSDFELVALVTGTALLASHVPLHHATLWCASDNTPAVSWSPKALHPPTPPMLFSSACSSIPAAEEPLAYDLRLFPVPLM